MNVIGVDVGTTSVRLAIISFCGGQAKEAVVLASHKKEINYRQNGNRFEQNSSQIWEAICECSKACLRKSEVDTASIKSIGFSATCSLVVVQNDPSDTKDDIIMWMDHRAIREAQMITNSGSQVLEQFGSVCSPEFSLAKMLWLKLNEPDKFNAASGFFELPDWLVFRCIGGTPSSCPRSLCCVTCKWGYDVNADSHRNGICGLNLLELKDKIGQTVLKPGQIAGSMSYRAACELGLLDILDTQIEETSTQTNILVGASLIDAHAGMLAMLSFPLHRLGINSQFHSTFCSLVGTSSCHMLLSKNANSTFGIWGPYCNVIIDGYYLLEAGQSLSGKLIEMCIESHSEGQSRLKNGENIYSIIESLNQQLKDKKSDCDVHILPSYHGNRSPLSNPRLRGGVYGLSADGPMTLSQYYEATVHSLAYETKYIIAKLGSNLDAVLVSGGLMKNGYFMQTLANVLQCCTIRVGLKEIDFMVLGSGLIARHTALSTQKLLNQVVDTDTLTKESIANMKYDQIDFKIYNPNKDQYYNHEKRYLCYMEFVKFSLQVDKIMNS